MLKISTSGRKFVDSAGRQRIFNGVNLCDKGYHDKELNKRIYKPDEYFSEELIKTLADDGFNIVRLGLTWDAVEPQPEKYNEEYLAKIRAVADRCAKYGIYFYLDMHQDLYTGGNGLAGDGAPEWACLTGGAKFKPAKFVWAEGYFWGRAVHRAFDAFWENKTYKGIPLQTYYCNMWKHVAEEFKDHPALFGFDLLNEPFPGTDGGRVFRKLIAGVVKTVLTDKRCKLSFFAKQIFSGNVIRCLEPFADYSLFRKATSGADGIIHRFDTGRYSDFLNRTASAVRQVTDNGIIMMENSYYSNLGIPYSTPAVSIVKDGKSAPQREEKLCFAPHAYDLMVDTPEYKYASNTRVGGIFDEHRRSQERLDVPLLVGEWGGQSEGTEWLDHIEYLLDKFDSYQWGQTYWAYYDGLLENPIMRDLVRTAPVAVTGDIESYSYDRENRVFTLAYNQDKEYDGPTEIYLHAQPESVTVDEGDTGFETDGHILKITTAPGAHRVTVKFPATEAE